MKCTVTVIGWNYNENTTIRVMIESLMNTTYQDFQKKELVGSQ